MAQLALDLEPAQGARPHLFVEQLAARPTPLLRPVHRRVCVADQQVGADRLAVRRAGHGDPYAGGDEVLGPLHRVGLGEGGGDPVGDRHGLVLVGEAVDQDAELVPAEAGDDVARAQVGAQPRRDRPQQRVAGVVTHAVVDQLEVVEVEEEDADRRPGGRGAPQRVAQRVDEAEPVGEPGQRVVQDPVTQRLVGDVALDRVGQHVRRGLHEVDVLRGEAAGVGRVDVEHPERVVFAVDHHGEAAADPQHPQHRRHREPLLGGPVGDDHVQSRVERRAGVGVARRGDAAARPRHLALEPGAQAEAAAVAANLPDAGALHTVDPLDQRDRRAHQRVWVAVLQRPLAELGDDGLLGDGALQLLLGDFALGDVVEDPVPDGHPVLVGLQHRLIEDPDDLAVAGDHPVVDRRRVTLADRLPRLLGQRPLAVLGVQQFRPQLRVLLPVLGPVAEDLLDLRTDVAPAAVLAELGGVDDRGKALDQAAVVLPARGDLIEKFVDLLVRPVPVSGRPVHSPRLSTNRRVP